MNLQYTFAKGHFWHYAAYEISLPFFKEPVPPGFQALLKKPAKTAIKRPD